MQVLTQKTSKRSPKWTKTQTQVQHPRGPFGTLGVLSGANAGYNLKALGLR